MEAAAKEVAQDQLAVAQEALLGLPEVSFQGAVVEWGIYRLPPEEWDQSGPRPLELLGVARNLSPRCSFLGYRVVFAAVELGPSLETAGRRIEMGQKSILAGIAKEFARREQRDCPSVRS